MLKQRHWKFTASSVARAIEGPAVAETNGPSEKPETGRNQIFRAWWTWCFTRLMMVKSSMYPVDNGEKFDVWWTWWTYHLFDVFILYNYLQMIFYKKISHEKKNNFERIPSMVINRNKCTAPRSTSFFLCMQCLGWIYHQQKAKHVDPTECIGILPTACIRTLWFVRGLVLLPAAVQKPHFLTLRVWNLHELLAGSLKALESPSTHTKRPGNWENPAEEQKEGKQRSRIAEKHANK